MDEKEINQLQNNFYHINLIQSLDKTLIQQILQRCKQNQYLSIICQFNGDKASLVAEQLSYLNQLIGLKFQFLREQIKTDNDILTIANSLKYLSNLKYLYVNFSSQTNSFIFKKKAAEFGKSLSTLKNLQLLSLTIYETSYLDTEGAKEISKGISQLNQLTNLEFVLKFNNEFEDYDIISELFQCFQYISQLKNLYLSFLKKSYIGNIGLNEIFSQVKYLDNLEIFRLQIDEKNGINEYGMKFLKDQISMLNKLQKIRIEIFSNKLQKQFVIDFIETILQFENLIEIQLSLEMFNYQQIYIGSQQFQRKELINENKQQLFKINTQLKSLTLRLKQNNITYQDYQLCQAVTNWLQNCLKLETFKSDVLPFYDSQFLNTIKEDFFFPQKIRQLTLNLLTIKNKLDLIKMFLQIQNLAQLEKLELIINFKIHKNYLKECFNNCFQKLQNLKGLTFMEVSSQGEGLTCLSESLKYLKQLEQLTISTEFNMNESLVELEKSFKQLNNLKILYLGLNLMRYNFCIDIEVGVKLIKVISSLVNLNKLSLHFQINKSSQIQYLIQCSNILCELKQLRILDIKSIFKFDFANYHLKFISSKYLRLVTIK